MANETELQVRVRAHDDASHVIKGIESSIIRFVGAVTASLAALRVAAFPIQAARDFEAAMKNVQKTTGFTDSEIRQFGDSLLETSKSMSVTATGLAEIAAIGGQLGLGTEGIKSMEAFTTSVARATVTLDLTEEQAASTVATITKLFDIPISQTEKIISTINALTNSSVANAQELGDIVRRVGNIGGLQFEQAAALAAYSRDLGETQEVAGTSLVKFFSNMQSKATQFAKVMNVTTKEWVDIVNNDQVDALQRVSRKMAELDSVTKAGLINTLFGQGRQFSNASKIIADVNKETSTLNQHMKTAFASFESGQSSVEEYNKIMEGFGKQTDALVNTITALSISVGQKLLPQLTGYVQELQEFFDGDGVKVFFDGVASNFSELLDNIAEFVRWVASLDIEWTNLIAVLKIFIGISIAKAVIAITAALLAQGSVLFTVLRSYKSLTAFLSTYATASVAASTSANAAQTGASKSATAMQLAIGAAAATTSRSSVIMGLYTAAVAKAAAAMQFLTFTADQNRFMAGRSTRAWKDWGAAILAGVGSIASLRVSIGGIIAAIGNLGVRILGALTGPVGAALSLIYVFWDDISDFFGFASKEASTIQRNAEIEAKKARERLETTINEFTDLSNRKIDKGSVDLDLSVKISEGGLASAQEDVKRLGSEYQTLSKIISNGTDVQDIMTERVTVLGVEAFKAGQALKDALSSGERDPAIIKPLVDNLEIAERKTEAAELSLTKLRTRLAEATNRFNEMGQVIAKNATPAIQALAEQGLVVTERATGIQELNERYEQLGRAIEDAEAAGKKKTAAALTQEQKILGVAITDSTAILATQVDEFKEAGKSIDVTRQSMGRMIVDMVTAGDVSPLRGLVQDLEEAEQSGFIKNSDQEREKIIQMINAYARVKSATDLVIKGFQESRRSVEAMASTAKGAFDNLPKTLQGISKDLRDFRKELASTRDKLKLDLEFQIKEQNIDEQLAKQISDIEKRFNKLIARVQDPDSESGQKYIARLEERKNKEIELAEARAQSSKDEATANALRDKSTKAMAAYNKAMGDAAKVVKRLQSTESLGSDERAKLLAEGQLAVEKVKGAYEGAKNAAAELNEFSGRKLSPFSTDLEFSKAIVPDSEKEKVEKAFADTELKYKQLLTGLVVGNNDLGQGISVALNDTIAPMQALNTQASNFLKNITKGNKELEGVIGSIVKDYDQLLTKSGEVTGAFKNLQTNPVLFKLPDADEYRKTLTDGIGEEASNELISAFGGFDYDTLVGAKMGDAVRNTLKQGKYEFTADVLVPDDIETKIGVSFDKDQAQTALNKLDLSALVNLSVGAVNKADGGFVAAADGGYIRGPGSGRSDSVPAWLSNGEYVMDSWSTSYFGAAFFKKLQSIARGGTGLRIPKFADGGLVSPTPLLSGGGVLGSFANIQPQTDERVELVLVDPTTGSESGKVTGSRESVRTLVDALKQIRRR